MDDNRNEQIEVDIGHLVRINILWAYSMGNQEDEDLGSLRTQGSCHGQKVMVGHFVFEPIYGLLKKKNRCQTV